MSKLNRLEAMRVYRTECSALDLSSWFALWENNRIIVDVDYQRDYVWEEQQQDEFFNSIMSGLPLSNIAVVKTYHGGSFVYEIVDGKQRLLTLKKLMDDQIQLCIDGERLFYSELSMAEKNMFESCVMPMVRLVNASRLDKLNYFMRVNFSGVPQSEQHKNKVLKLIEIETEIENSQKVIM